MRLLGSKYDDTYFGWKTVLRAVKKLTVGNGV